ncbi:hypothetical protein M0220_01585 [Halomonas qinghailakensis]|uniref:Uncharacterized protein n=1 Tax=Halomonas qinghailakensis TaxID=2937790 RepID=A0AA46TQZ1_9GAMM|nr:hypothetical protein [Halomonas sp. ZZQ-149]UYO74884.1 hypothetical protein M0220_01585 [Halomonas sp. ZZQ-149]
MSDPSQEPSGNKGLGVLMWVAFGLFVVFFLNVALQRFSPGLVELSAAQEAMLLVAATGVFISACLKLEARHSHNA